VRFRPSERPKEDPQMLQVIRTKIKGSWAIYGVKEAEVSLSTILGPQGQRSFLRTLSGYQSLGNWEPPQRQKGSLGNCRNPIWPHLCSRSDTISSSSVEKEASRENS
jgi:hypothetical protein